MRLKINVRRLKGILMTMLMLVSVFSSTVNAAQTVQLLAAKVPPNPAVIVVAPNNIIIEKGSPALVTVATEPGFTRVKLITDNDMFVTESATFIEEMGKHLFMLQVTPEMSQTYKAVPGDSTQYYVHESMPVVVTVIGQPEIINTSVSQTSAKPGDTVTVTVTANPMTTRIWLVNTKNVNDIIESNDSKIMGNQKIFTLKWKVNERGNIDARLYAGNDDGFNSLYKLISVTTATTVVDIIDVVPQNSRLIDGIKATVNVAASAETTKVRLSTTNNPIAAETSEFTVDSSGRKIFSLTWIPDNIGHQIITASAFDKSNNSDFIDTVIYIDKPDPQTPYPQSNGSIKDVSVSANQVVEGGTVLFKVITNNSVDYIRHGPDRYPDFNIKATHSFLEDFKGNRIFYFIYTPTTMAGKNLWVNIYGQCTNGGVTWRLEEFFSLKKLTILPNPIKMNPVINSVKPSTLTAKAGEIVEIEVRTNKSATSVVLNNTSYAGNYAKGVPDKSTSTENVFLIKYRPAWFGTLSLEVVAYSPTGNASGNNTFNLGASALGTLEPFIYDVALSQSKITRGSVTRMYITTSIAVKDIELNVPFSIINDSDYRSDYQTLNMLGSKLYILDVYPPSTGAVDITIKAVTEKGLSVTQNETIIVENPQ